MKHNILRKTLITIFSILFILMIIPFLISDSKEQFFDDFTNKVPLFSNESFTSTLSEPNVLPKDNLKAFTIIFNIVESYLSQETENDTEAIKQARDIALANDILAAASGYKISIESAEELYNFSNAQSFNYKYAASVNRYGYERTIKALLSLDYILMRDIDYSTMRARKFVPIGTNIYIKVGSEIIDHVYEFTGTFDGNGHTISNLYLADYSYITTTIQFDNDESTNTDISIIKHYSMFSLVGEEAVIKNFILRNPIYELLDATTELTQTSMIVGENNGTIFNVGVIDEKTTQQGLDNSGIRFSIQYSTSSNYTSGGFVHTNNGVIINSFIISKNVISPGLAFRFSRAPFAYTNNGSIVNSAYSIQLNDTSNNNDVIEGVLAYTLQQFKQGFVETEVGDPTYPNRIKLNFDNHNIVDEPKWYFYEKDGYPKLVGLEFDETNQVFNIYNEYDFANFLTMINFTSSYKGKTLDEHDYVLKNHINMANMKFIKTPSKTFSGTLSGGDTDFTLSSTNNDNMYIFNLTLSSPYVFGSEFYLGLFSNLSGTVKNINLYNNKVDLLETNKHIGKTFYIGAVAARSTGIIKNVVSNSEINLGNEALGPTFVGGIAGTASNKITFVVNKGPVNGGQHAFNGTNAGTNYYIGGIVGTNTDTLEISYTSNLGGVTGIGTTDDNFAGNDVTTYIGGIIGEVHNINETGNSLKYLTNRGNIDSNQFIGSTNFDSITYAGGIFGSTKGFGYKLSEKKETVDVVRNGRFENKGTILGGYINEYTYLYGAGIGVMNTNQLYANVSYMINTGGFTYTDFNHGTDNKHLFYAATVIDNSTTGITLSRAYNTKEFEYSTNYFINNSGYIPSEIKIAPLFKSTKNAPSKLYFVENMGNLTVGSASNQTTVTRKLKISNITQAEKIDYTNVINSGNIYVFNLNNTTDAIYVAGISWILPIVSNTVYKMKNSFNEGKIVTAGILGNVTINSYSGTSHLETDFSSNITSRNLYVAGLINLNVGEITNSYNLGEITSNYSQGLRDIIGTGNTYVGGVVTFNYNKIQDVANSGDILYTNTSSSVAYFAGTTVPTGTGSSSSTFGGITIAYTGGLTLGGIAAGIGNRNATELNNLGRYEGSNETIFAQILDTANNGTIYGKAESYVRSGGILGIALGVELASGTHNNTSITENITPGPFGRSVIGVNDSIRFASLQNGLNFGNVYAVTETIGEYLNEPGTGSTNGSDPTAQRPGINAAAGGIIAYGLTTMTRMLNHGVVSSTDVAGGVIGATYILGTPTSEGSNYYVTPVNINTAVHYGKVKAIKQTAYADFEYDANDDFNENNNPNHTRYYIDGDTTFIFPSENNMDLTTRPSKKRGFGGIFGRMQRGNRGAMRADDFSNIMNMDPNVDLIGRADANLPGSMIFYRFYNSNKQETYYTARLNDTTSASVIGWIDIRNYGNINNANDITFSIRRNGNGTPGSPYSYHVRQNITVSNYTSQINRIQHTRSKMEYNGTAVTTTSYDIDMTPYDEFISASRSISSGYTGTTYSANYDISRYGITVADVQNLFTSNTTVSYTTTNYNILTRITNSTNRTPFQNLLISSNIGNNARYEMQKISDVENVPGTLYIFDENFPLMNTDNAKFIYQANKDVLANRFQNGESNEKPNGGMYVLASTQGRENGAVLPSNIKINDLFRIDETQFKHIDVFDPPTLTDRVDSGVAESSVEKMIKAYKDMFQLAANDKSLVLPKEDQPNLADLVLYDPNGVAPTLSGGILDNTNHTITFNVADNAFADSLGGFTYKVLSANLSENAVIAKNGITLEEHSNFNAAYKASTTNIIKSSSFESVFTGSVSTGNQTTFTMTVYSEISAKDSGLISKYIQPYTIIINRSTTNITNTTNITIDGNSTSTSTVDDTITITSPGLGVNSNMQVTITETTSPTQFIPSGHTLTIHDVYYNSEIIDSAFYTYELQPKLNSSLGFTFSLDKQLPHGTYKVEYSLFEGSTKYYIEVTNNKSNLDYVEEVYYDTYSKDNENNDLTFIPTNTDFTTYIEFGYQFIGVTATNQNVTFIPVYREQDPNQDGIIDYPTYLNNILHYKVYLNGVLIIKRIKISDWAQIMDGTINYGYHPVTGIKTYYLNYNIKSEGAATSIPITHAIVERPLESMIVYLNDNIQTSSTIDITREALETRIDIDFNFINDVLNQNVTFEVSKDNLPFIFTPNEIFSEAGYYFHLIITSELEKGEKEYKFTLNRDNGAATYTLGTLEINKLEGVSAYLTDIRFQIDSGLTVVYPLIKALDEENLSLLPQYDTRVYFDGIDYANANTDGVKVFRIDGKVSDLVLESYSPNFSLPFGATIERFDGQNWVSNLETDFLGDENQAAVIRYRVISEDGQNMVEYYITVTDIKYNLTLKFNIYYEFSNGSIVRAEHESSPIKNKVVLITVVNLKMNSSFNPLEAVFDEPNNIYPDVYNYISGINSQSSLFYFTNPVTDYIYRFGRNTTGSYNFSIVSPIYTGPTNDGLVTGKRYDYTIYLETHANGNWHSENYELPNDPNQVYNGRFYFVRSSSPNQIVRQFAIVIKESTSNINWGLTDDDTTWDN